MDGWVKFYRQTFENPIVCKDCEHLALWMLLLAKATHKDTNVLFNGEVITLHAGQLLINSTEVNEKLKIEKTKTHRIFLALQSATQIAIQKGHKNLLITIVNWEKYQNDETQTATENAMQVQRNCNASATPYNKNEKNYIKKEKMLSQEKKKSDDDVDSSSFNRFVERFKINVDNYSGVISEMDFDKLSDAFAESAWLQENMISLSAICNNYLKIIGRYYKDYVSVKKADFEERRYDLGEYASVVTNVDELENIDL